MNKVKTNQKEVSLSSDWAKKNAKLIQKAYTVALKENYDLSSVKDVKKLLKIVESSSVTEDKVKAFSGVLQIFDRMVKEKKGKQATIN